MELKRQPVRFSQLGVDGENRHSLSMVMDVVCRDRAFDSSPSCSMHPDSKSPPARTCPQLDWVHFPVVQRNWQLNAILREAEQQLCGGAYSPFGCTLAVQIVAPVIAMPSIIFLVLGDMSAALIGRSFGQSMFPGMKLGPGGT